jgi:hypothetical protein
VWYFCFCFYHIFKRSTLDLKKNNINLPIASGRPTASITTFGLIRIGLNALQSLISVETTEVNLTLLYCMSFCTISSGHYIAYLSISGF